MEPLKILIIEDNKIDFITIHNVIKEYLDNINLHPNIPKNNDESWENLIDKIQYFSSNGFTNIFNEKEFKNINLFIVDISLLGGNNDRTGLSFISFMEENIGKNKNINYILVSKGSKLTRFKSKWYSNFFETNFVDKDYEGKYYGEKIIKKIKKIYEN